MKIVLTNLDFRRLMMFSSRQRDRERGGERERDRKKIILTNLDFRRTLSLSKQIVVKPLSLFL